MGFGFNLGIIFLVIPASIVLLIISAVRKEKIYAQIVGIGWLGILLLVLASIFIFPLFKDSPVTQEGYYGTYVIDRNFYPGVQADWQYETYKFEITNDDSIRLHVYNGARIVRTYRSSVSFTKTSKTTLVKIDSLGVHHIFTTNPTLYRGSSDFYLVFESPKFGNMFFRKEE